MTDSTEREIPAPLPAASVILLREGGAGMEVLLLRRSARADYLAEAWVFPGGVVEAEDGTDPLSLETARAAASRETREEAGIELDPAALVPYSQWCPPPESPKRFLTWFFVAAAPHHDDVMVDGAEITEHIWVNPAEGLAARDAGKVTLMPPTWMALRDLSLQPSIGAVLDMARAGPRRTGRRGCFRPAQGRPARRWTSSRSGTATPASATGDAAAPGARHRLHMGADPWFYDRS